jgi:beta-N-acetylhexosaminidase
MKRALILAGFLALAGLTLASRTGVSQLSAEPQALANLRQVAEGASEFDRKIGQMIMVGFQGDDERDPGVMAVRDQLAQGTIGGLVLYPENIGAPRQLRLLTAFLLNANSKLVPLIAVDQEGGHVQRLNWRSGYSYFPSARNVARDPELRTKDGAFRLYHEMAEELAAEGINLNFGPVVDLSTNGANPVIALRKRSFGADPSTVTDLARAFIEAHREANVLTAAKHFPGHGSSRTDSHKSLPDISHTWHESELKPYVNLAASSDLDMVMVGHLYHPRFSDGPGTPTSVSERAAAALRDNGYIGFQGVVVSDDLEMDAVRKHFSLRDRTVKAVNAGIDLLVFSNIKTRDPRLGPKVHAIIAEAVRDGSIPREKIEAAYGRIAALKERLMRHDLAAKG